MTEKIQFVDENDNPIGSGTRDEAWAKGIYHRIARVVLQDENGRILSQLRSAHKKSYPNRWTDSASGHVDEGEDYETAIRREMKEEIGVETELEYVGKFLTKHINNGVETPVFNGVYKGVVDSSITLRLQESEVTETKWFDLSELKVAIQANPDTFTPGFIEVINRFY